MLYFEKGSPDTVIAGAELRQIVFETLKKLGERKNVLVIPPDFTRFFSRAGEITRYIHEFYGENLKAILPALGTHSAMTEEQIQEMFGDIPRNLFKVHDWRNDVVTLGWVPGSYISEITGGRIDYDWPAQVNKLLVDGKFDLILSVGQVVPHEVIGMANYNKNIFVGTGGSEGINKSHFIGAAYGMERIMGRAGNPVRAVFNYASEHFTKNLPIFYFQTVIGRSTQGLVMRGLYAADDISCFNLAAELSLKVNFEIVPKPIKKCVVYLDPAEFKSTWLGNKAVYRTRMAMADGGELIILAPGLKEFGEDAGIDRLIRRYGYFGTEKTLAAVKSDPELAASLGSAAHMIHGSSEGRFSITYAPGHLTREEIEGAGFIYGDLESLTEKYNPAVLKDGYNTVDGEEIFYISNPALGLWSVAERFA